MFLWMLVFLHNCCTQNVFGQDSLVPSAFISPKIKAGLTRDPATLARALTEGKTTEKEKFDALFAWVVNNIGYDYRLYYSGKGNPANNPLERVLRRRKGVCTDYARLMDALCAEVGIDNRTVDGYTKDLLFDINDTLYFDNHAWNAVKLNGLWYLYDITWSSGTTVYELTRFGKWRMAQIELQRKKVKTYTVSLVTKGRKSAFCGDKKSRLIAKVEGTRIKPIPRLLIGVLGLLPFRLKEKHKKVSNTDYYLTQPEVFAIDHFPNNAIWSLQGKLDSVVDFSADSAVFYQTRLTYQNQQREGRFCLKCDDIFRYDAIGKQKYLIRTSEENNPRNRLLPANAYLTIGQLFSEQFFKENDSITKMALYDSTIYYLNQSKLEYRKSRRANGINQRFQQTKNRVKKTEVLRENKAHKKWVSNELKDVKRRYIKIKSLRKKTRLYLRRSQNDNKNLMKAFNKTVSLKPLNTEKERMIRQKLEKDMRASDSLSYLIVV